MNLNYESGKVGDYKGTPVYTIEEIKFEPKRANRNFIYALGHQGTSENLNLIFWDGSVWRQLMQQVVMLKRIDLIQDQFIPLERQKLRKRKIG